MPNDTVTPEPNATATLVPSPGTPTPEATSQAAYNASYAVNGKSGGGILGILNSNMVPIAAAVMSLIVVVGGVAYYMSDRSRVPPEMPNQPSHDDLYGMVLGEPRKRARKPKQ